MTITLHFWVLAFLLVPVLTWKVVHWSAPKEATTSERMWAVGAIVVYTWAFMASARWLP